MLCSFGYLFLSEYFGFPEINCTSSLGFAVEVLRHNLPFQVNWSGPNVKDMKVDDEECLKTLVKMVRALEELQPNIPGVLYIDILGSSWQTCVSAILKFNSVTLI